ncbi:hypothetical protein HDU93_003033, partial [Gonapodya sp. JEL0774]
MQREKNNDIIRSVRDYTEDFCSAGCLDGVFQAYNSFFDSPLRDHASLSLHFADQLRAYPLVAARLSALALLDLSRTGSFANSLGIVDELVAARYLTSGERHVPEVWIEDYATVQKLVWTEPGQTNIFSLDWFVRIMSVLNLNSFRVVLPVRKG